LAEASLALVCVLYGGLLIVHPESAWDSQATMDLAWQGYARLIAVPFLVKAVFTGLGLIGNIKGWPSSHFLRLVGALFGSFIWVWLITKFIWSGAPFTFGSICAIVFLILSIRIIGMALAGLPHPGAPGAT
jgi:hypothetical protein